MHIYRVVVRNKIVGAMGIEVKSELGPKEFGKLYSKSRVRKLIRIQQLA